MVTGFASAALLWVWLSNVDTGLFSPLAQDIGLTSDRVNILASFTPAFWSVIAMVIWKMAGFYMVILMSGLQSIPADYIEAARIDGAKWSQRFRFIIMPLIRKPFALALILCISGSMLAFDQFLHHSQRWTAQPDRYSRLQDLQRKLCFIPPRLWRSSLHGSVAHFAGAECHSTCVPE